MAPETLAFMPNGDVTLILIRYVMKEVGALSRTSSVLSNASALDKSFSALEQTSIDEDGRLGAASGLGAEALGEPEGLEESVVYFAPDPPDNVDGPSYPPPPRAKRGSDASSRRDRSASPPASFWASLKRQTAKGVEPSEDEQAVTQPIPAKKPERVVESSHEVHCVVSSRHMMLASQYFQRILSGNFNEAITLRNKGHVTITLSDDLDAMIILLNIIHGASRKVPRQVNLGLLSKLAVLVRRFEVLETVGYFSDTWIDNFRRKGLPKLYNEKVLPLIFVFSVFDRPSEFKDMTRLAQREGNEKLDEDVRDVPISHSIIDAIKRDRELAIETAIMVIHTIIDRYMADKTICDGSLDDELRYACDSMVLGSLMNSSRKIGVWPKPEAPFNGRKFKDLARAIRTIRILDVCNKTSSRRWNSHGPSSNCHGLEDTIEASMKSIEAGLDGLELSDYAEKSEDINFGFQTIPLEPSKNELKEQTKTDTRENSQVYIKEEAVEAPKEEVEVHRRQYSEPEPRISTRIDSREAEEPEKEQKQTNVAPKEHLKAEVGISARARSGAVEVPAQDEVKDAPRQYSREFRQPEAGVSPGVSVQEVQEPVKEEKKATPRDSPSQESRMLAKVKANTADEPPREEVKPVLSEEVNLLAYRKLNRTPSFRKIPSEEVKSPVKELQVAPRVASIEEMIEEVSHPAKEEVKTSMIEVRESPSAAPNPTESEEMWASPKSFKMRKSKKTFSTRY